MTKISKVLILVTGLLLGLPVFAEMSPEDVEAEIENIEIRDMEATRKNAIDQARFHEKLHKESAKNLEATRVKRHAVGRKSQKDIDVAERRRKDAIYLQKKAEKNTLALENEIRVLEDKAEKARARANAAEEDMHKANQELQQKQAERKDLIERRELAERKLTASETANAKYVAEIKRITGEVKFLEAALGKTENELDRTQRSLESNKQTLRNLRTRKLVAQKSLNGNRKPASYKR